MFDIKINKHCFYNAKFQTPQIWVIVKIIVLTLTLVISNCVLNQPCGY